MKDEPHGNDIEHLRAKPADIVERLRGHYDYTQPECYAWHKEAADEIVLLRGALKYNEAEIERLRALIERLRAAAKLALHEMVDTKAPRNSFTDAVDALDAALNPRKP